MKKNILVCGGAGFIGHHLAKKLKTQGHHVVVVDIKDTFEASEFCSVDSYCDNYFKMDLANEDSWATIHNNCPPFNEIYQLAADMGGAGYIFTGDNDADIMNNSARINLNCANFSKRKNVKVFYSSSACMYPAYNQLDPSNPKCSEDSAYPADPDSEYGWEKLFSERLYLAYRRNYNLDIRIARLHNVFGPEGAWNNGKEKAPAAMCRKVAEAKRDKNSDIEMWGTGTQTRSFLYIEDCLDAIELLMSSEDFDGPVNIGSEEIVSINKLVNYISTIADYKVIIHHIDGPIGVKGRNSDNSLINAKLGWEPKYRLLEGLQKTYLWIENQINEKSTYNN